MTLKKMKALNKKIADIGMMIETSLGYIESEEKIEAIYHLEVAQRMCRKLIRIPETPVPAFKRGEK